MNKLEFNICNEVLTLPESYSEGLIAKLSTIYAEAQPEEKRKAIEQITRDVKMLASPPDLVGLQSERELITDRSKSVSLDKLRSEITPLLTELEREMQVIANKIDFNKIDKLRNDVALLSYEIELYYLQVACEVSGAKFDELKEKATNEDFEQARALHDAIPKYVRLRLIKK